ncbi:(S)-ureidoglycine aminohydrolase [Roseibaca ekhonensis]|uniref:(S)-ureidoglycine aminohydrolase n=1 Tax=Roseinatronobacter ekhonensis TaxID=254356 RepID=A0A3B0MWA9_9RHOB|nr:bifunctional allantoicase/(S)-ureidoglycine aminohydrolase [Roseibaca ekhonensis]SUZ33004.1 (S)-ureidoglycine aminohydrolase [Roseibaca ekhonensis]
MTDQPNPARSYFVPKGGLPPQSQLVTDRAMFTEAFAVIPRGVLSDIVASALPFWDAARFWVLARPLSGFAETFSQYIVELGAGGGSDRPETDANAEAALFVVEGALDIILDGATHSLQSGGFGYIPSGKEWRIRAETGAVFHWIRKRYIAVDGLPAPDAFFVQEQDLTPNTMPDTNGGWATTRFMDPADLRHDMHVTIVTLQPGAVIPFDETHVMEHGLYVLQGKGVYHLNQQWVEVEAGDFMWLRAFCPQACYAGGPKPFRYLLYKDVNRHAALP